MHDTAAPAVEPYLMLLDVSKAIAAHCNVSDLFDDLTTSLQRLLDFHYLNVVLYDAAQHVMRLHTLESSVRSTLQPGAAFAVEDIPSGWVWQHQQPLVVRDLAQETRFPRGVQLLREHSVRSFCCLPLTTAQRRLTAGPAAALSGDLGYPAAPARAHRCHPRRRLGGPRQLSMAGERPGAAERHQARRHPHPRHRPAAAAGRMAAQSGCDGRSPRP